MNRTGLVALLVLLALSGCMTLTGPNGQDLEVKYTEGVWYAESFSAGETRTTTLLKALVKGSIYETGETVSVFGTCLNGDDEPVSTATATLSAWYPNGTLLINQTPMVEIQDAYFLYTGPMNAVRGTYLTEMRCYDPASNSSALAFGEWQNPYWVSRIADIQTEINNISVNINTSQINVTLNLSGAFTEVLNEIYYVQEQMDNQTEFMNNSFNQTWEILSNNLDNITLQFQALEFFIDTEFSTLNQSIDAQFAAFQNWTDGQLNDTEDLIRAVNQSIHLELDDIDSLIAALDAAMASNFTDVYDFLVAFNQSVDQRFDDVDSAIVLLDSVVDAGFDQLETNITQLGDNITAQFSDVNAFLAQMNSSLHAEHDYTQTLILALNSTMDQRFNDVDAFLSALNVSLEEISANVTLNQQLIQSINTTIVNEIDENQALILAVNQSMFDQFSTLTSTILSEFTDISNQITSVNDTLISVNQSISADIDAALTAILGNLTSELAVVNDGIFNLSVQIDDHHENVTNQITTLSNVVGGNYNVTLEYLQNLTINLSLLDDTVQGIEEYLFVEQNDTLYAILGNITQMRTDIDNIQLTLSSIQGNLTLIRADLSTIITITTETRQIVTTINQTVTDINSTVNNISQELNLTEVEILARLGELEDNFTITIGDFRQNVTQGFEITWDKLDSINATINETFENLSQQIYIVGQIANSSVDRTDSYLAELIKNLTGIVTPVNLTGNPVNFTEDAEALVYRQDWTIEVQVPDPDGSGFLAWPDVNCQIETTQTTPAVDMDPVGNFFEFTEFITVTGTFDWTVTCFYN